MATPPPRQPLWGGGRHLPRHIEKENKMTENLMTTKQVSTYIGIAVSTLILYRATGEGPKYIKILRRLVRYRRADVDAWLDAQKNN